MIGKIETLTPTAAAFSSGYLSSWCLSTTITCLFFSAFPIALNINILNVAILKVSSEFRPHGDIAWYETASYNFVFVE